jgi:hypothetical protein
MSKQYVTAAAADLHNYSFKQTLAVLITWIKHCFSGVSKFGFKTDIENLKIEELNFCNRFDKGKKMTAPFNDSELTQIDQPDDLEDSGFEGPWNPDFESTHIFLSKLDFQK